MNTKSKATAATIGLGALVLSGGTLALWQHQADLSAVTISAGHLSITPGDVKYYDVSELKLQENAGGIVRTMPDVTGSKSMEELADHPIDIGTFKATPGDSILVVQEIVPTLVGDNLLAQAQILDKDAKPLDSNVTYPVAGNGDGKEAFSITAPQLFRGLDATTGELTPLDAENSPSGDTAWVFTQADSGRSLFVAYEVTFSKDDGPVGGLTDAPEMDATVAIRNLGVQLTQVRPATS